MVYDCTLTLPSRTTFCTRKNDNRPSWSSPTNISPTLPTSRRRIFHSISLQSSWNLPRPIPARTTSTHLSREASTPPRKKSAVAGSAPTKTRKTNSCWNLASSSRKRSPPEIPKPSPSPCSKPPSPRA
uniref:(northern house mosquito) hypothetical protein n=1 Tax=Culex pipiens TaxID=7175 RepID=A0A8D8AN55_CULPI